MLEMIRCHLVSWQSKYLSMGGRVALIRLVLSSLVIYQMLVSILLEGVKRKLHGFSIVSYGGFLGQEKDASGFGPCRS